ncbi:unnamed protein product [Nippostrongylus brasiliensis]|uniref:Reverse transcriptase domain-containing protein n=1 Tax=Nippostrongylus brasiliensis TaxID=27835 RepID=A0A0N4YFK5_NIPBR|nr:unnamed protein product [Nippostrongylus brasiliensis]
MCRLDISYVDNERQTRGRFVLGHRANTTGEDSVQLASDKKSCQKLRFTKGEDDGYELDVDGVPNPRFREHRSNRDCACGQPDLSQMIYDDRRLRHLGHLKDHCEDLMR